MKGEGKSKTEVKGKGKVSQRLRGKGRVKEGSLRSGVGG